MKHEDNDKMKEVVKEYFVSLFTSEINHIEQSVSSDVHRKVTAGMNQLLMAPFDREEVRKALFNIGDLKAPGPDGLHAIFKRFWGMLDLVDEVLLAINNATIPAGWNETTIVMIPKVNNPEKSGTFTVQYGV